MQTKFSLATVAAVLLVTADCCDAAVGYGRAAAHPAHPNSCYFPNLNLAVRAGARKIPEGHCTALFCDRRADGVLYYTQTGCGSIGKAPPGCRTVTVHGRRYPACCPEIVCDQPAP
ncbi:U-scoloptoxin(16)-Ssd1a-like [Hyalella azteca]|uniref:U-scoloptoxin(16)-Ssd1a-like n=1 Tax=Hyalella azteca TaxID=294128 RepID=A0A8B7PBG0_HYAAZ|nr:U-scoloptoxin(16)-Ssd1a-like [Hyalella azteca]